MKSQRPTNTGFGDITKYKLPLPGIVSILHRISGIILFLFIPFLLWMLDASLNSPFTFYWLKACLTSLTGKLVIWAVLSALLYHMMAGVKHIIMDFGLGESLKGARIGSAVILILTIIVIALLGVWLL